VEESFKCLRCGYEYSMPESTKQEVRERVCPRCKSNSVRKIAPK
jgi:DNA-directed RNA polymerase subunit RPC12/RpoP